MNSLPTLSPTEAPVTEKELCIWIRDLVAKLLKRQPEDIDIRLPFFDYGLESMQAVSLASDLEAKLGRKIPEAVLWDHPTILGLASHLVNGAR